MAKEKATVFISPAFTLGYHEALFTPQQGTNEAGEPSGPPKYGLKAIWTPAKFTERDKELWATLLSELDRVSLAKFKKGWKKLPANIKKGLRDGMEDEEYCGEGTMFASLTSIHPIGVINAAGDEISAAAGNASQLYNGCVCRAQLSVYTFDVPKARGVAIGIRNLQKLVDGKRIGGGQTAKQAFSDGVDDEYARTLSEQNEDSVL